MAKRTPTTIEHTPSGLRIVMPVPRIGFVIVFLSIWLMGWAAGEVSALRALLESGTRFNPTGLFLLVWLVGWTLGGAAAAFVLAMMLDGREIVTFALGSVVRRIEAFRWGWETTYAMDTVTNLRQTGDSEGVKSFISFDASGKTVRFGTGLKKTERERQGEAERG